MSIDIKEAMAETAWVEQLADECARYLHERVEAGAVHQAMFPQDTALEVREHLWDGTASQARHLSHRLMDWLRSHPVPPELTP